MTAREPDLRVLAVGHADAARRLPRIHEWLRDGCEVVLCEAPAGAAAALPEGCSRDFCSPGFVPGVVAALAEAGVSKAGGPGVAELHRREVAALGRANALAQAVMSIGDVLRDMAKDIRTTGRFKGGQEVSVVACSAISEIIESVAADVLGTDAGKRAREVLAAHGWVCTGGDPAQYWYRGDRDKMTACVFRGTVEFGGGDSHPPAVLRAFATLAEESKP